MKLLNLFCFISIINICFNIWVFLNFLLTPGLTTGSNLKMNTYSTNLNRGKHYSRNYSNPISKHSYCFKCKRVLLFLFWANFNWIYVFHPTKRRCYSSWFAGKGCYRAGRNTRVWCCIYASHNINIRTKWMVIVSGPWAWTRLDWCIRRGLDDMWMLVLPFQLMYVYNVSYDERTPRHTYPETKEIKKKTVMMEEKFIMRRLLI